MNRRGATEMTQAAVVGTGAPATDLQAGRAAYAAQAAHGWFGAVHRRGAGWGRAHARRVRLEWAMICFAYLECWDYW